MGFVVKNTTKFGLLDLLCPHSCRGCGCLGTVLCDCCKNYIMEQHSDLCPICQQTFSTQNPNNKQKPFRCQNCESPFLGTFVVGYRTGALADLIKNFKYHSVRAAAPILTDLLDATIPPDLEKMLVPSSPIDVKIVVVPLPTIGKHVRARGLDHTKILAQRLARRRGWQYRPLLSRAQDTVQVGTKASERQAQAKTAYRININPDPNVYYLLLDDIWTTGATMLAAAKLLQDAGAKHLLAALLATGQPQKENVRK